MLSKSTLYTNVCYQSQLSKVWYLPLQCDTCDYSAVHAAPVRWRGYFWAQRFLTDGALNIFVRFLLFVLFVLFVLFILFVLLILVVLFVLVVLKSVATNIFAVSHVLCNYFRLYASPMGLFYSSDRSSIRT